MTSLLADPELVLCSWTVPDATLQERVRAAAAAGYGGIGLRARDYRAAREAGASDGDLRALLERSGIRVVELDSVFDWMLDGEAAARSRATEDNLYRVADAVGAVHLVVNPNPRAMFEETAAVPLELKAERFSAVCDRAAEHGLLVALEFLPWTGIPHASDAWDIVRMADRPNGGVLVDSWHHFRGRGRRATCCWRSRRSASWRCRSTTPTRSRSARCSRTRSAAGASRARAASTWSASCACSTRTAWSRRWASRSWPTTCAAATPSRSRAARRRPCTASSSAPPA